MIIAEEPELEQAYYELAHCYDLVGNYTESLLYLKNNKIISIFVKN